MRFCRAALPLGMAIALVAGCDSKDSPYDGSTEWGGVSCPLHGIDKLVDMATAATLTAGQEATGTVCPARDSDYYKITHNGSLLNIDLFGSVDDSGTPVQLTYVILDKDGKSVAQAPAYSGGGIRQFKDFHCLQSGTYFIQVKDEGDDAKDDSNLYHLKVSSAQDKDPNEPANDTQAGAKPPGTGYISCKGDKDWYTFTIGANQIAEVSLKTDKTTPLALKYTIYDGKTQIVTDGGTVDGTKAPLNLLSLSCLPKAGTYTLLVEDAAGHSDPDTPYTLTVTPKAESDANENPRNDSPTTATACGSSCTKTGQINCKGDNDYYKVDLAGVTPTSPGVIEIDVNYGGPAAVQPQATLLFADETTPCTKDNCCRVLSGSCQNSDDDCRRRSYNCIQKDDTFCSDIDCKPSSTCITERACAGAVICLPNQLCAAEQVTRGADKNGRVFFAAPLLHPGPFYVRVSDLKSGWDYGKPYTVTIKARLDPDGTKELNSEYFPNLLPTNFDTAAWHRKAADQHPPVTLTVGGTATMDGYISYTGDQDWYLLKPPGAACGADNTCTLTVKFSASGSTCGNIQPVYQLWKDNEDKPWFAFPADGQPLSGDPGCVYVNSASDYYWVVSDYQHNGWSWDCHYSVSITAAAGCNAPCVIESGTSGSGCTTP